MPLAKCSCKKLPLVSSFSFENFKSDAAAYPIIGGIAPTTAPTHVFNQCTCFKGVYTHAYNKIFPLPNIAVVSFVYSFKYHVPQIPLVTANAIAFPTDNLPLGNGRRIVLAIIPSCFLSSIWFKLFAENAHKAVPKDASSIVFIFFATLFSSFFFFAPFPLSSSFDTAVPTIAPAAAVLTTNADSLNLDKSLYVCTTFCARSTIDVVPVDVDDECRLPHRGDPFRNTHSFFAIIVVCLPSFKEGKKSDDDDDDEDDEEEEEETDAISAPRREMNDIIVLFAVVPEADIVFLLLFLLFLFLLSFLG